MERLTEFLYGRAFLLENWKWLGLLALALTGVALDRVTVWLLDRGLKRGFARVGLDVVLAPGTLRPFGILTMSLFWSVAVTLMVLPPQVQLVLGTATTFMATAAGVWGAWRLVDVITAVLGAKAANTDTKFDDLLVPLLRNGLKVFVAAFGLVFVASNLNVDISSLLAGLGIGGLAFALAAQDTVKNLFGTMTVITDRPFDVGDWVVIGAVEGTVEAVGFRSTRIRTFYNSVITVPNGTLLNANVDNLGVRQYRRWKTMVSITYDTPPDRIEAFCEGIRELVRTHPYTRKDYQQVYLNAFSASSLDILLYIFHETPDWSTELRERQRLMLDIIRLANRLGVEFAFPTQTLHVGSLPAATVQSTANVPEGATEIDPLRLGAAEARAIALAGLGSFDVKPPPVQVEAGTPDRGSAGE